jgi:hypothetical protein
MLWNIDSSSLAIGLTVVAALAFFFGSVLDAIMKENGFGPTGNALLFTAGFIGAVYVANRHGVGLRDLRLTVACGLGGAFAFFSALALLKAGLARR